ncbi:carboxylating nicotinate-nucleotide diphosphorylase [Candidatus Aerophobetes bacterium]|uniref:Probable nicotinate-nucleotide pyrophosphorylase [carboxylating] n=1 Tax=Aerophobetes bacterium TaxID=2030807 RepID=A0A497E385_UNCAE|nr:MAG: carboxylating nicotinate-nucleotide diphosphorylase [Candidatus Aerophobetes bacterium]
MLDLNVVRPIIQKALDEDIGRGDITSQAIIPPSSISKAEIISHEEGVLAGVEIAKEVFRLLSPRHLTFTSSLKDGELLTEGRCILRFEADSLVILKGERVALNFLQRLSGIATLTRKFVDLVSPFGVRILDTRKTTPNLRILEKYAVRVGGGFNHRFGLDNGILIKDNHIRILGGIKKAVQMARRNNHPFLKVEVEVSDVSQVEEAIESDADAIMLDNMSEEEMREVVSKIRRRKREILIEASGDVSLENVKDVASTGVDLISVGRITHSAPSLDINLKIVER